MRALARQASMEVSGMTRAFDAYYQKGRLYRFEGEKACSLLIKTAGPPSGCNHVYRVKGIVEGDSVLSVLIELMIVVRPEGGP